MKRFLTVSAPLIAVLLFGLVASTSSIYDMKRQNEELRTELRYYKVAYSELAIAFQDFIDKINLLMDECDESNK